MRGYVSFDGARGDGGVAGAKTLILGGFAELLARYEVVFLRKMRWISFHR